LAGQVESAVKEHISVVDWTEKDDVQREMRKAVKKALRFAKVPADELDQVTAGIIDLAKHRKNGHG
jgi:type I restriction enzyme R subunit